MSIAQVAALALAALAIALAGYALVLLANLRESPRVRSRDFMYRGRVEAPDWVEVTTVDDPKPVYICGRCGTAGDPDEGKHCT